MERETLANHIDRTAKELRLELAQITAASQVLERHTDGQKGRDYLAVVNQSICRMLRVVKRLELGYRLTDEDEIRLLPKRVEFGEWTRKLGARIQGVLAGIGVEFVYSGPEQLFGGADSGLLTQLVLELVSNGAQAGNRVVLTVTGDEEKVCISVSDNGKGVAAEKLPQLLSREQEDEDGCGLALAQQITELHGGTLMANNAAGRGLTMVAVIPLRKLPKENCLRSPRVEWDAGGFDDVLVALSNQLPVEAFRPEDLG